jgi:hypothetical protein
MKLKLGLLIGLMAMLFLASCATVPVHAPVILQVNNFTLFAVSIYVDDVYLGTMQPFTKDAVHISYGYHKLFGKAIGTSLVWGPTYITDTESYKWNLTE